MGRAGRTYFHKGLVVCSLRASAGQILGRALSCDRIGLVGSCLPTERVTVEQGQDSRRIRGGGRSAKGLFWKPDASMSWRHERMSSRDFWRSSRWWRVG